MNKANLVFIFLVSVLVSFQLHASRSEEYKLAGKVISFDEKKVSIQSGDMVYDFQKKDLNFPSFKVGQEIQVPVTDTVLKNTPKRSLKAKK